MSDQLGLDVDGPPVAEHRVHVLATVLAGFRWPERGGFERLKKAQKEACLTAARNALRSLAREGD